MKSSLYISILILLGCICCKQPACADTVELRTGKVFDGKILVVDSKNVKVKDDNHVYILKREDVVRINFDNTPLKPESPPLYVAPDAPAYSTGSSTGTVKTQAKKYKNIKYAQSTGKYDEKPKKSGSKNEVASNTSNTYVTPATQQPEAAPEMTQSTANVATQTTETPKPKKEKKKKKDQQPQNTANANQNNQIASASVPASPEYAGAPMNITLPSDLPGMEFITSIEGSSSKGTYYGIYSNSPEEKNLTLYLPNKKIKALSFRLFAQKNGSAPALYTASSIIFIDKNGVIISKSNPYIIENDNFLEWFSNLEEIAGLTGEKAVNIDVPQGTAVIKIIGYRPESKNNLVGYISDVKLDNKDIKNIFNK